MATLTQSGIISTVRSRVGDDDSANYLASDTAFAGFITAANVALAKYLKNEGEDTSITTDGSTRSYSLPSGILKAQIQQLWLRTGSDDRTDRPINVREVHHGKIYLPFVPVSGNKLVIWYFKTFTIGTDDMPEHVAELLYKLVQVEWINYAVLKRADFEQWAATNRSDARIPELYVVRARLYDDVDRLAQTWGSQLEVTDIGGGR